MKLTVYNQQTNKNTISNGDKIDAVGSLASYGNGGDAGWGVLAKGLMAAKDAYEGKVIKDNKVALANAQTEYQKRINDLLANEKTGLLHTQLGGAAGITNTFAEKEAEIRSDIQSKLPRYQYAVDDFNNYAEQNTLNNMSRVESHERQQGDRYTEVTRTNHLQALGESVSIGYGNLGTIGMALSSAVKLNQSLLSEYGEEYVKSKNQESVDKLGLAAINSAINNNDYDAIDQMLPTLRQYGVSEKILSEAEAKAKKINTQLDINNSVTADVSKYGDNVEAAKAEYLKRYQAKYGGGMNINKLNETIKPYIGMAYSLGADGTDAIDCGLFTQKVWGALGYQLNNRTADAQYKQLEDAKQLVSKDKVQEGDLVFYHVPDNDGRWAPSDDPNSINSDDSAYKGITHVGIYVGNGQVMQAGSKGVGPIPIDTYEVVGVGRAPGKELTPTQKLQAEQEYETAYRAELAKQKRAEREALENQVKSLTIAANQMALNGASNAEILQYYQQAIDNNPKLLGTSIGNIAVSLKRGVSRVSASGGSGGSSDMQHANEAQVDMILRAVGEGQSKEQIMELMENSGLGFDYKQTKKIWSAYDDKTNGKGAYSPDMQGIKQEVMSRTGMNSDEINRLWPGVSSLMGSKIAEWQQAHGGEEPSYVDKVKIAQELVTDQTLTITERGLFDFKWASPNYDITASPALLRVHGFVSMTNAIGDDGNPYVVFTKPNGDTETVDPATARQMLGLS